MAIATHLDVDTNDLENGLDFILSHFSQEQQLFPRKIMTKKLGYQKEVYSKKESLDYFQQSDYSDCRINAFSSFTEYKGIQRYPPDLIFIDLDKYNFKTDKSFKFALSKTLRNIREKLEGFPTVLETGGGYHILLPIFCPTVLENVKEFNGFDRPSEQFLRFAKDNLSNGKADKNNNPSFRSCLLRIPGSINSKYNNKITIIQKWNGIRPNIPFEFMEDFRSSLIQKKIDEYRQNRQGQQQKRKRNNHHDNLKNRHSNYYQWIEKLLETPIEEYRKLVLWRILCPYLKNIRKLSYDESYQILRVWIDKCNSVRKLDFNPKHKIRYELEHVGNYNPIGIQKLKTNADTKDLYNFLINNKKLGIAI